MSRMTTRLVISDVRLFCEMDTGPKSRMRPCAPGSCCVAPPKKNWMMDQKSTVTQTATRWTPEKKNRPEHHPDMDIFQPNS